MNTLRHSNLFLAATCLAGLVSVSQAQTGLAGTPVRAMDTATHRGRVIDAGLAGQASKKQPRQFDPSLIHSAPLNNAPGLKGQVERKAAQVFQGSIDPKSSVVNVGSHPSFVQLKDASIDSASDSGKGAERALETSPRASSLDPRAYLTYPADGSRLSAVENFMWSPGFQAQDYVMYVGSCQDCTDILNQDLGSAASNVVYLPADGRVIYVTLFTKYAGYWYWVDYQFVAAYSQPLPAQMISPTPGATLAPSQTFTWSNGAYVQEYYLWIGSCQDCYDILNESEGLNNSRTVSLPTDGRTIYVSMFSAIGGLWYWYDYQFRATAAQTYTPRIYVTNNLDFPINVIVNGVTIGSVSAQNTQYADVTVTSLSVSFTLVQPTLNGNSLGDAMAGIFQTIYNPSGSYSFTVTNVIGQQPYFEPLISNGSSTPLLIDVNGGLQAENRCNCVAPAYSTNVSTGYYQLFSNGNVRLFWGNSNYTGRYWYWGTDSTGAVSTGGTMPSYVDSVGHAFLWVTSAP